MNTFKKRGNQQFTEDGRNAEITVDLVWQARATLGDNKVNGPEDAIVSEMTKKLPFEKIHTFARRFQERFMGLMESLSSWKIVKTGLLEETGRCPEGRDQKLQSNSADIGDVKVVCILLFFCAWRGKKEPEKWKNLHVGAFNGISCQHLQVIVANLLRNTWDWQEERNPVLRHGTVVRPTLHSASLDIRTAFDEAKPPKHVAQILDYHNTH